MFQGFTEATGSFLWGLAFHNEKPWFEAHREEFERDLKTPFTALARETFGALQEMYPDRAFLLHIARIYRDARRLFGRGPYKEHLWFSIKPDQKLLSGVMFWFEVGAEDYSWGVGCYDATPGQMAAYRAAIDANPGPLSRLAQQLNAQTRFVLDGPVYKRPKGDVGELLNPWYNRKYLSLIHRGEFGPDLFTPDLPRILAEDYRFLMPFYDYLQQFNVPPDATGFREAPREK